MRLEKVAAEISQKAGWRNPITDVEQIITYELNDGLIFNIHSPDGRKIFFFSYLRSLPQDDYLAKNMVEKCAKHSISTCKKNNVVLSITNDKFMLHQDVSELADVDISLAAKDFLNNLGKWKNFVTTL